METEGWQALVHVCRLWRRLVLESPRRLNLQLYCVPQTPAKVTLDVWPALPLIVCGDMASSGTDNIIAALGQHDRVSQVDLYGLADLQLEQVSAAMLVPFPELTHLQLFLKNGETARRVIIPDSFLDGSARRMRHLKLSGVPFPGLPKLQFSATHLFQLSLYNIPHSGYFSPGAIVALISTLSGLETLEFTFQSPQSCPDGQSRLPPSPKRSVIPALTYLRFKGVIEYFEDLVAGIDTPQLDRLDIVFFNQINFDIPRLAQFINRTPKLRKQRDAHVQFDDNFVRVQLSPLGRSAIGYLRIAVSCSEPDWQLSSIEQVCNSSLHPLSKVEGLYIEHEYSELVWKDDAIGDTLWWQLLLPFIAVDNLYLSKEFSPGIAAALKELVGDRMITTVLPSLRDISVKGLEPSGRLFRENVVQENIEQFVAARQLSDHTIAISDWYEYVDTESV